MGQVIETKTTYKTTGGNNVPGSTTVNPADGAAYDNSEARYNHDGNDVSGFVGVDEDRRTYATSTQKPGGQVSGPLELGLEGDHEDSEESSEGDELSLDNPQPRKSTAKKAAPAKSAK